jgi:hypothetical protein
MSYMHTRQGGGISNQGKVGGEGGRDQIRQAVGGGKVGGGVRKAY